VNTRLSEVLAHEGVRVDLIRHRTAYTAQERAAVCHISGHTLAKVVIVHDAADDWFGLAVLPAASSLDVMALREWTGRPGLRLATETEFSRLFPDCPVGAIPPFGRLYGGLDVFLDGSLAECPELVCDAGAHDEELRMPMTEYLRIERPEVVPLAPRRRAA
jgi:Ala-tRNA(Pro) deacylase